MGRILDSIKIAAMSEQRAESLIDANEAMANRYSQDPRWAYGTLGGMAGGGLLGAGLGALIGKGSGALIGGGTGAFAGILAGAALAGKSVERDRRREMSEVFPEYVGREGILDDAVNRKYRGAAIGSSVGSLAGALAGAGIGDAIGSEAIFPGAMIGSMAGTLGGYGIGKSMTGEKDKERAIRMLMETSR